MYISVTTFHRLNTHIHFHLKSLSTFRLPHRNANENFESSLPQREQVYFRKTCNAYLSSLLECILWNHKNMDAWIQILELFVQNDGLYVHRMFIILLEWKYLYSFIHIQTVLFAHILAKSYRIFTMLSSPNEYVMKSKAIYMNGTLCA